MTVKLIFQPQMRFFVGGSNLLQMFTILDWKVILELKTLKYFESDHSLRIPDLYYVRIFLTTEVILRILRLSVLQNKLHVWLSYLVRCFSQLWSLHINVMTIHTGKTIAKAKYFWNILHKILICHQHCIRNKIWCHYMLFTDTSSALLWHSHSLRIHRP